MPGEKMAAPEVDSTAPGPLLPRLHPKPPGLSPTGSGHPGGRGWVGPGSPPPPLAAEQVKSSAGDPAASPAPEGKFSPTGGLLCWPPCTRTPRGDARLPKVAGGRAESVMVAGGGGGARPGKEAGGGGGGGCDASDEAGGSTLQKSRRGEWKPRAGSDARRRRHSPLQAAEGRKEGRKSSPGREENIAKGGGGA